MDVTEEAAKLAARLDQTRKLAAEKVAPATIGTAVLSLLERNAPLTVESIIAEIEALGTFGKEGTAAAIARLRSTSQA